MKKFYVSAVVAIVCAIVFLMNITRIETGEVGIRIGFDKQIKPGELLPGSFNQTLIGGVLTFPVKDVNVTIENMTPIANDNSTMKDFDIVVVYSINPNAVSELYTQKNKSFHALTESGDTLVMYNYVTQMARNAVYKAARAHEALAMNDQRAAMEVAIKNDITGMLVSENLGQSINITQVMIRSILPADTVVQSANELVRAKKRAEAKRS